MNDQLINKLSQKEEELLKIAIENSDIKLLIRWIKVITGLFSKEIKSKNDRNIKKIFQVIIDLTENLLALLEMDTEDSIIYLGPSIFECIIKISTVFDDYMKYLDSSKLEENDKINFSEEQIKALEKIKNLLI